MRRNIWTSRGVTQVSVKFVFVSYHRKSSLRSLRCFTKFLLPRKLYGWEKGISRFSVDIFCLTLPQTLFRNSSVFQKNYGIDKIVWMRKGDITFSGKIFCPKLPETFFGKPSFLTFFRRKFSVSQYQTFSLRTLHGFKKFLLWEEMNGLDGRHRKFPSNLILPPFTEKFPLELFVVWEKFWQQNVFMDAKEGYHVFPSIFFVSHYR